MEERLASCYRDQVGSIIMPLRAGVECLVGRTLRNPELYSMRGQCIRDEVSVFIDQNISSLPEKISVAPNLTLNTATKELQRRGQNPGMCQAELFGVWFTHSGLIVNALERRFEER